MRGLEDIFPAYMGYGRREGENLPNFALGVEVLKIFSLSPTMRHIYWKNQMMICFKNVAFVVFASALTYETLLFLQVQNSPLRPYSLTYSRSRYIGHDNKKSAGLT